MSRHRRSTTSRRLGRAALAVGALVIAAVGLGSESSLALFRDSATMTAGSAGTGASTAFVAGTVAVPVTPTATANATQVTVGWTTTRVGPVGGYPDYYEILRHTSATGGTGVVACTTPAAAGSAPPTTCAVAAPSVTTYYSVRARVGTSWQNEGARVAFSPVLPPTNVGCGGTLLNAVVQWTAPTGTAPTGYRLSWTSTDGTGVVPYAAGTTQGRPPAPPNGGTRVFTVTVASLQGTLVSAPSASTTITARSLGNGVIWSCG